MREGETGRICVCLYERERLLNLESEREKVKEFDSVCLCLIEKERDSESDGL